MRTRNKVGRIWLMDAAGRITNTCLYDVPTQMRESVLHIAGSAFQAMRQEANGTWVYRYACPAPTSATDPFLKDMRNDQSPEWDGPVLDTTPATMDEVRQHFEQTRSLVMSRNHGLSQAEFQQLYDHFVAAQEKRPF